MRVAVYEMHHGNCPYLPDRTWITHAIPNAPIDEATYEAMLDEGWRRSGGIYYQNHCPGCNLCIPIRVPAERFQPSKSQRRVLRKNEDVTIEVVGSGFDQEVFELYARYSDEWHGGAERTSESQYRQFLAEPPIESMIVKYRIGSDGPLVGAGWLDVLPGGLSSVYFAFNPDHADRSLGTFSAMREIELTARLRKRWYYLGFWVPGSRKMEYKNRFLPYQLLVDGAWREFTTRPPNL